MSLQLSTRAQTRSVMLAEIEAYLKNLPDYDRWTDFFESSTGKSMLDLLTGISELLIYKLEIRSLDSYLPTALSQSAAYLLSQMVGYNPNRKSHGVGTVKLNFRLVTPMPMTISEGFTFDGDIPMVVSQNTVIPEGTTSISVPVHQGTWILAEFNRSLSNLEGRDWEVLYLNTPNFNIDQYKIYVEVDGVLLDLVQRIELVKNTSVIVRTDYKGGVLLLFGDGTFGYRLRSSSEVRVRYLYTQGRDGFVAANTDMGTYVLGSQVFDARVDTAVQGGSNEDSIEKVKYLASRFFQAQGRAVTAYDYEAVIMSFPGVISAKAVRVMDACCTISICALKDTVYSIDPVYPITWNTIEVNDLLDYLDDYKVLSSRVIFHQPEAVLLNLSVNLVVPPLFVKGDLETRFIEYLKNAYCYKLGGRFLSTKVIDDITNNFPEVKRSYIMEVNDQSNYPDIRLLYYEFFKPGNIVVTTQTEVS